MRGLRHAPLVGAVEAEEGSIEADADRREAPLDLGLDRGGLVGTDQAPTDARLVADEHEPVPEVRSKRTQALDLGAQPHERRIPGVADVIDHRAVAIEQQRLRSRVRHDPSTPSRARAAVVERPGTSGRNSTRPP